MWVPVHFDRSFGVRVRCQSRLTGFGDICTNHSAQVSNLVGMGPECPPGEMSGAYEHFDVVELKPNGIGATELIGVRKHPETQVAESCGNGRTRYAQRTEFTRARFILLAYAWRQDTRSRCKEARPWQTGLLDSHSLQHSC